MAKKAKEEIINLNPRGSECCVCGTPLTDCRKGIPMFEGCAVRADWPGEWGGRDACDACFEKWETGKMPFYPNDPNAKPEESK